jgi:LacI family transcriptional regulator
MLVRIGMSLDEVAKLAGVSTATVSRVLNNVKVVSPATWARVTAAAKKLNYHPNLHARSLAGRKTNTVGLVVSNLENPFFFDIFHALEARAHLQDYEVLIANTGYQPEQLRRSVQTMIGRRVDGLALVVSEMNAQVLSELEHYSNRVVFCDVGTRGRNRARIRVDYGRGTESTVAYLHELGHRRLAFIGHHSSLAPTSERERAFINSASARAPRTVWKTTATQDSLEGGRQGAAQILQSGFAPTAIVCVNDLTAAGAMRELRERGLQVPNDVSVTGFDGVTLGEFCAPALTTVMIPRDRIGSLTFDLLMDQRPSARSVRDVIIQPELVVRSSTAAPRKAKRNAP